MHQIKQYDTVELQWRLNADISDAASVRLIINSRTRPNPALVDREVEVVDNNTVSTLLSSIDTENPGDYNVEVEVEWQDGQIETFPSRGYERLRILPDLGGHVQ